MENSVSSLQLGHLMIEGAVIAVSIELVFRCIFAPANQKSLLIRCLKIIMALAMTIKSSLFSAFSTSALGSESCKLSGRLADTFFHISSVAGLFVLLSRAMVLIPKKYKMFFTVLHGCLIIVRIGLGAADTIFARIWVDQETGMCRYADVNQAGVAYTILDFIIDLYVTVTVTIILSLHIRNLKNVGVKGNSSLYISVVTENVFRTVILSIMNLLSTIYFVASNNSPVMVLIIWPINNLLFIVLIGYDTNITKSVSSLQSLMYRTRQQHYQSHSRNTENFGSLSYMANNGVVNNGGRVKPNLPLNSRRSSSPILEIDHFQDSAVKLSDMPDTTSASNIFNSTDATPIVPRINIQGSSNDNLRML